MRIRNLYLSIALMSASFAMDAAGQTQSDVNVSQGGYGLIKTNIATSCGYGWGNIESSFATRVSYEMIRKKGFTLTANARYSSVEVDFEDEDISKGYNPEDISLNGCHVFGQLGFTSMFNTRLFGKYFMGMAMVDSEWGARKFQRISGIAMALCMLRVNRNTQFGLGPIILVNSCSRIPAFLVFMYRHRFNDRWLLNLYGGMFGVDYTLTKNDLISIGADIDVKSFYFKPHNENLPRNCRFTSTSFRPMAKYRRRLGRNLYLDVQGGISLKMSSRVNGVSSSKQYFECRQKTAPFLQAGVSYSL